jgi:hypothetical protein
MKGGSKMPDIEFDDLNFGMTDQEEDELFQEATEEGLLDEDEN